MLALTLAQMEQRKSGPRGGLSPQEGIGKAVNSLRVGQ